MESISGKNAPSTSLVLPHFVFGASALLLAGLLIVLAPEALTQHYFNNSLLSITHLLVLGWLTMIIMGALYQLLPVIIEESLFSEGLAKFTFYLFTIGLTALATGFWNGWFGAFINGAGIIVLFAILLFVVNVFLTGSKVKRISIEHLFIRTAIFWLLLTVIAGLLSAINLLNPFLGVSHLQLLKLHAHAGMFGWFMLLVMGVGSKLFPMFLVVDKLKRTALKLSYALINIALVMGLTATYFHWMPGIVASILMGSSGLFSFMYFVFHAFKNRMKKSLDIGMKQTVVAFAFLFLAILIMTFILVGLDGLQMESSMAIAYGVSVFFGFFTALTMGQTYKTLPFIVWLKMYKDKVGKEKTPMPKDLYNEGIARAQMLIFAPGLLLLLMAVLLRNNFIVTTGAAIITLSALMYLVNVLKIVMHSAKGQKVDIAIVKEEKLLHLLKNVIDPELMINIVDLGLVYELDLDDKTKEIKVEMTLSSKACPLGDAIIENVYQVLTSAYPDYEVNVELVWEPAWNSGMITVEGKNSLGGKM